MYRLRHRRLWSPPGKSLIRMQLKIDETKWPRQGSLKICNIRLITVNSFYCSSLICHRQITYSHCHNLDAANCVVVVEKSCTFQHSDRLLHLRLSSHNSSSIFCNGYDVIININKRMFINRIGQLCEDLLREGDAERSVWKCGSFFL